MALFIVACQDVSQRKRLLLLGSVLIDDLCQFLRCFGFLSKIIHLMLDLLPHIHSGMLGSFCYRMDSTIWAFIEHYVLRVDKLAIELHRAQLGHALLHCMELNYRWAIAAWRHSPRTLLSIVPTINGPVARNYLVKGDLQHVLLRLFIIGPCGDRVLSAAHLALWYISLVFFRFLLIRGWSQMLTRWILSLVTRPRLDYQRLCLVPLMLHFVKLINYLNSIHILLKQ